MGKVSKILVFDCDVHQGDGTASIFENDAAVFTVSLHCQDNYPFVKSLSDIDVGLPPGTEDEQYMEACKTTLQVAIDQCRPELVIYDAGMFVTDFNILGYSFCNNREYTDVSTRCGCISR